MFEDNDLGLPRIKTLEQKQEEEKVGQFYLGMLCGAFVSTVVAIGVLAYIM